jgi:hypothetical protein
MTDSSGRTTRDAVQRLRDALSDPARLFTGTEVAYLMGAAGRWGSDAARDEAVPDEIAWRAGWLAGYEDAHAELTALAARPYPPPPYLLVQGEKVRREQADVRREARADRSQRWAGGGPEKAMTAFMWGDE